MALRFDVSERGGDRVVDAEHVSIEVGDRVLLRDFTGVLMRGDVLGLIGPNGAGKTTLIRTLVGERETAEGQLRIGASIQPGYYRQDLSQVPLDKTLYEAIEGLRPHWERRTVQGHLGRFGFSGDEVQRSVSSLSGGERARLGLAMLMLSRSNLLILDEPTNHLDVESIEALEDAIERYDGTAILISHDRALLRALVTRVWLLHDGQMTVFDGSFAEWEVVSAEREHAARVRASEEVSLRRMKEKQKTTRRESAEESAKRSLRRARVEVDESEADVARLEARVNELSRALEAPELYTRPDASMVAAALGVDLERARRELDASLERWAAATAALESVAPESGSGM